MQKVTKELLAAIGTNKISYPKFDATKITNVTTLESAIALIKGREIVLINQLMSIMKTKLGRGEALFTVWMKEESDLIQAVSKSYGERICVEQTLAAYTRETNPELKYRLV